jgi:hypothetical protein
MTPTCSRRSKKGRKPERKTRGDVMTEGGDVIELVRTNVTRRTLSSDNEKLEKGFSEWHLIYDNREATWTIMTHDTNLKATYMINNATTLDLRSQPERTCCTVNAGIHMIYGANGESIKSLWGGGKAITRDLESVVVEVRSNCYIGVFFQKIQGHF